MRLATYWPLGSWLRPNFPGRRPPQSKTAWQFFFEFSGLSLLSREDGHQASFEDPLPGQDFLQPSNNEKKSRQNQANAGKKNDFWHRWNHCLSNQISKKMWFFLIFF